MIYWIFHLDGTIQLEIKLSGILNTAAMNPDEDLRGEGTCVYPGVNAHNHQHLFCLRIDPNLDSSPNSVVQVDAMPSPHPVGHPENKYGNVFTAQRTKYTTVTDAISDYDSSTGRSWDICNESRNNPYSGKPVAYKLISREVPRSVSPPLDAASSTNNLQTTSKRRFPGMEARWLRPTRPPCNALLRQSTSPSRPARPADLR
jgi:primary-amine oxidase